MASQLLFGVDHFLQQAKNKKRRYALVTNDAACTMSGVESRRALLKNGFLITRLFSPEHGIHATGEDGSFQPDVPDPLTGLHVISLYGERLAPAAQDLVEVDAVLFDIPDVGCRFYTYLWTMTHVMESCAANQKQLIILDRPNPLGGILEMAEGPVMHPQCTSFIGRWNIPIRHSSTFGELAAYFADTYVKNLELEIVRTSGWQRDIYGNGWFRPTSPAIPDLDTALLYPGLGLLEGLNVDEGRGTKPFRLFGAHWIKATELGEILQAPGISFHPVNYVPPKGIYKGERCAGLECTVTDPSSAKPVAFGLSLIRCLDTLHPGRLQERPYPTRANPSGAGHIDKLLGIPGALQKIKNSEAVDTSATGWENTIGPFLLY